MSEIPSSSTSLEEDVAARIAHGLVTEGFVTVPDALPPAITEGLFQYVRELNADSLRRAGIGRLTDHQLNRFVRGDRIQWLEPGHPAGTPYLAWMEELRNALNRRLFLGLFDYESHFAHYPPGAFYKRHTDAFAGQANRRLTTVLYLNPGWTTDDGGELYIYHGDQTRPFHRALPIYGTLVVFLSEEFPHEVRPARRDRYSVTGWFRVNGTQGRTLDPPS